MNRDELKKVLVVEKILDGQLTNMEGATVLGLTTRQIIRLKKRYQAEGAKGIIHKNRGRKPVHALSPATKESVAALYTGKYQGSNNCHFAELLEEHESLKLSSSSVRRILLGKRFRHTARALQRSAHHLPLAQRETDR